MGIHESGEMYLETIYVLQKKHSAVRSVDISEQTATEDACRLEHAISDESFEAIKRHISRQ